MSGRGSEQQPLRVGCPQGNGLPGQAWVKYSALLVALTGAATECAAWVFFCVSPSSEKEVFPSCPSCHECTGIGSSAYLPRAESFWVWVGSGLALQWNQGLSLASSFLTFSFLCFRKLAWLLESQCLKCTSVPCQECAFIPFMCSAAHTGPVGLPTCMASPSAPPHSA